MESVTFWKNNNQGGSPTSFDYQQANRTGFSDADSLSSNAYLVIFDQNDYKGNHAKFGPGAANNDLKKLQRGSDSGHNWKNQVNSFVFYKNKPSWWDNGTPTVDLPVPANGIFVAEDSNFSGDNRVLLGTNDYSDLNDEKYTTNSGRDLKDNITSLKTGSSCWAEVFDGTNFSGDSIKIYPNLMYKNLNDISRTVDGAVVSKDWSNQIQSMHVYDHQPASWNMGFDTNKFLGLYDYYVELDNGFNYKTQGASYNIYYPKLSNPDADTLQLDFALEFVITGENTDNMALTLCFNSQGALTSTTCQISGNNGFEVNSFVIDAIDVTVAAAGLLAAIETEGASVVAATEFIQNMDSIESFLNTASEKIFNLIDNTDGRFYFMAVAGNVMAKASTCLTF